jgi:RNA polymerase sigma-70 factor (ECF subfamily)
MAAWINNPAGALAPAGLSDAPVTSAVDLNRFLAAVEKKAFYMARAAVGNEEDALDLVQDAMFTLARKYADKDPAQWQPLFYRILQNRITDWHRRSSVRRRIFSFLGMSAEDDVEDPVAQAPGPSVQEPAARTALDAASGQVAELLQQLPPRQRQTFLLRALEGLSVAETAQAMNCSQGSVKTQYSRAVHSLREALGDHWP